MQQLFTKLRYLYPQNISETQSETWQEFTRNFCFVVLSAPGLELVVLSPSRASARLLLVVDRWCRRRDLFSGFDLGSSWYDLHLTCQPFRKGPLGSHAVSISMAPSASDFACWTSCNQRSRSSSNYTCCVTDSMWGCRRGCRHHQNIGIPQRESDILQLLLC